MNDYLREMMSYFGLYRKMFGIRKKYKPVKVSYGEHKEQYFLYYEPDTIISDKIIVWVHGIRQGCFWRIGKRIKDWKNSFHG